MPGLAAAAAALGVLAVAGCGGGERQDANEPSGNFPMRVVSATFPRHQRLSQEAIMRIVVANTGSKDIAVPAVTIFKTGNGTQASAFSDNSKQADLASTSRPIWIVDRGPKNGDTAYSNTWTGPAIPAHRTATFRWRVSPVRAGVYAVSYVVAAGLNGKAKAVSPAGGPPRGVFIVRICGKPAQATVNGAGQVVNHGGRCG